jgi:hypothetical protein
MGGAKREKIKKPKKLRPRRPTAASKKSPSEEAQHLDQVVQEFDGAVERLQFSLEQLGGTLPALIALGVARDRRRRIKNLADAGILHSLQCLATALEKCGEARQLPDSLVPLQNSARMVCDHFCRAFEVQAVYVPGELLTVPEEHLKNFDWSADYSRERHFPAEVEILQSGWRAGDAVLVLPRVRVCQPVSESNTST